MIGNELEILLIALCDFRIKNLEYKLYEDIEIKQLIQKIIKENTNG